MAQIEEGNSGGREMNVELNLVPFIDLMSVCIIFLLITAVWSQVSMIQIGSSMYAKKQDTMQPAPPPPDDKDTLMLKVKASGYVVALNTSQVQIPKVAGANDEKRLLTYLRQIKQKYPTKEDVVITVDDELPFDDLIRGMDVLMLGGFSEISVGAVGG